MKSTSSLCVKKNMRKLSILVVKSDFLGQNNLDSSC